MVFIAAFCTAIIMFLVAIFQVALALGAPWGQAAYGGRQPGTLTPMLRVTSGLSAIILLFMGLVVLAQVDAFGPSPPAAFRGLVAGFAGFLFLSAVANFMSESRPERWVMGPAAFLTSALCAYVSLTS